MAEVVKHGVIGDPALFELCEQGWDALAADWGQVVRRAMAVKVKVIEEDPYEKGLRASLNLGHTVGHAIELASNFALRHGEAVAIGLVAEAWLAAELDLAPASLPEQLAAVLTGLGLPVEAPPDLDRTAILQAVQVDKKKAHGQVRFALPQQVGRVRTGVVVEDLEWALDVALAGGD
jgi:3-dehydroquinate synthetase